MTADNRVTPDDSAPRVRASMEEQPGWILETPGGRLPHRFQNRGRDRICPRDTPPEEGSTTWTWAG